MPLQLECQPACPMVAHQLENRVAANQQTEHRMIPRGGDAPAVARQPKGEVVGEAEVEAEGEVEDGAGQNQPARLVVLCN